MVESLNPEIRKIIDLWATGQAVMPVHIGNGAVFMVPSDSELGAFHVVSQVQLTSDGVTRRGWVCSCRAFRFNAGGDESCKHIQTVQDGLPTKLLPKSRSKSKTTKQRKAATRKRETQTR